MIASSGRCTYLARLFKVQARQHDCAPCLKVGGKITPSIEMASLLKEESKGLGMVLRLFPSCEWAGPLRLGCAFDVGDRSGAKARHNWIMIGYERKSFEYIFIVDSREQLVLPVVADHSTKVGSG